MRRVFVALLKSEPGVAANEPMSLCHLSSPSMLDTMREVARCEVQRSAELQSRRLPLFRELIKNPSSGLMCFNIYRCRSFSMIKQSSRHEDEMELWPGLLHE